MPLGLVAAANEAIKALLSDVATDPRQLKPGQLCRLLNSTPLGSVLDDRRLRRHRERAGGRVAGDDAGKSIDLLKYTAWLAVEWRSPATPSREGIGGSGLGTWDEKAAANYDRKKERERARNAEASRSGRDIGKIPAVADPKRRSAAEKSFRAFCESYFPDDFSLAWSDDHLKVINRIERAVVDGGQFALAMPRGSGKTTLCEKAVLWAAITGRRKFPMLIGAAQKAALEMLTSLKVALETNEPLAADFPEVCIPIIKLEGRANRCKGQLCEGERTHIGWAKDEIQLPTIKGSAASGVIIRVAGITGRIRGAKFARTDSTTVRPDLILIDDPQTDKSARSVTQCEQRERVISGTCLGLAGPGKSIAAFCTVTVIRRGDMADNLLNRDKHPAWQSERCKLVYEFPANTKLWEEYAVRRTDELKNGGDGAMATAFYRDNQKAMDAGSRVAWPARKKTDELSALQHAMNLKIDNEAAFFSEYQNEPLQEVAEQETLVFDDLIKRATNLARGRVPMACQRLTAFVDVQQKALFWIVTAWTGDFGGHIVDYGTWPDQDRRYFTLSDITSTLAKRYKGSGLEASIFAGLEDCTKYLFAREFVREDSAVLRIEKLLVDANWGASTETVYQWCRQSTHGALVMPSHGKYFGAASTPYEHFKRRDGEVRGKHWWLPELQKKRAIRHCMIDTNWWKSFVAARLLTPIGDRGALTLPGKPGAEQRMLGEHLTSESSVRTVNKAGGYEVDEWKLKPNRDNHWFDGLVGAAVAASMLGVELLGSDRKPPPPKRQRVRVEPLKC